MKKSAIAVTCVLCTLMLIATIFSISVNAANAATTEVFLTVEETTSATISETTVPETVTKPSSQTTATSDETPKTDDSKSVQTGNTVCIIAGTATLVSGLLTVWLERKRTK